MVSGITSCGSLWYASVLKIRTSLTFSVFTSGSKAVFKPSDGTWLIINYERRWKILWNAKSLETFKTVSLQWKYRENNETLTFKIRWRLLKDLLIPCIFHIQIGSLPQSPTTTMPFFLNSATTSKLSWKRSLRNISWLCTNSTEVGTWYY